MRIFAVEVEKNSEIHGYGRIQSTPGKGSIFIFTLPASRE